jgi:hypothetical protein
MEEVYRNILRFEYEDYLHKTHSLNDYSEFALAFNKLHEVNMPISEEILRYLYWQLDGNLYLLSKVLESLYNVFKYKVADGTVKEKQFRQWLYSDEFYERMNLAFHSVGPWQNEVPFASDKEEMKRFFEAMENQDLTEHLAKLDRFHMMKRFTTLSGKGTPKFCPLFQALYDKFYVSYYK